MTRAHPLVGIKNAPSVWLLAVSGSGFVAYDFSFNFCISLVVEQAALRVVSVACSDAWSFS